MKFIGRVIKDIQAIDTGFDWQLYEIGNRVYDAIKKFPECERKKFINQKTTFPNGIYLNREATIDEPLLIEFEDGDLLGIDFSEASRIRMELNTIPKNINAETNSKTFSADKLFCDIIGKKISDIEITTNIKKPVHFAPDWVKQLSYISSLTFIF